MSMTTSGKILLVLAGAVGLALWLRIDSPSSQDADRAAARSTAEEKNQERARQTVKQYVELMMKKGGLQKLDCDSHKAWLDPLLWYAADAQLKENMTRMIGIYCGGSRELEIYDAHSARKLASYGPWQGFKVY
jgi:hypothetical protein